jgi:hypothetical protein
VQSPRESENCGWTVKIQDCDFEGRPCVFRNAFGTLFTVTVKLRGGHVVQGLSKHSGTPTEVSGYGDDPLHTLSEDVYINEPQIFPPV